MTMKVQMFDESIKDIKGHLKDYLDIQGVENSNGRFICINPDHLDTHPSATIFNDDNGGQHLKCWSCLPSHEEVITPKGHIPIENISIGDLVYTKDGTYKRVLNKIITKNKKCNILNIKTHSYHPGVEMTDDHTVFCIKDALCNKSLTNCYCNPYGCNYLDLKRCRMPQLSNVISEVPAKELSKNDLLLYPVYKSTENYFLENFELNIDIDEDLLWLFGVYLAEGNTYPRVVEFTLNEDEEDFICKIVELSAKYFNAKCSFRSFSDSKSFKVRVHSSFFQRKIDLIFGTGCSIKTIPFEFRDIPNSLKQSFLKGIFDGDGVKDNGKLTLANKNIVKFYYDSMISLGNNVSYSEYSDYVGSDGISRKSTYSVYPYSANQNSYKNFFIKVDNIEYFVSGIQIYPSQRIHMIMFMI